jgi:hypothetical protein
VVLWFLPLQLVWFLPLQRVCNCGQCLRAFFSGASLVPPTGFMLHLPTAHSQFALWGVCTVNLSNPTGGIDTHHCTAFIIQRAQIIQIHTVMLTRVRYPVFHNIGQPERGFETTLDVPEFSRLVTVMIRQWHHLTSINYMVHSPAVVAFVAVVIRVRHTGYWSCEVGLSLLCSEH